MSAPAETKGSTPGQAGAGLPRFVSMILVWAVIMLGRDFLLPQQPTKEPSSSSSSTPVVTSEPSSSSSSSSSTPVVASSSSSPAKRRVVGTEDEEFALFEEEEEEEEEETVVASTLKKNGAPSPPATPQQRAAHSVLVKLCTSCGTQRNFLELKKFLEERYPGLLGPIEAEQYPPPALGVLAVSVAQVGQIAAVVVMLLGDKVFSFFGVTQIPPWFQTITDNKLMTFAAVWVANNLAAQTVATGAFEIYLDDTLVFSKLNTGRLPTASDILNTFKDNLSHVGGVAGGAAPRRLASVMDTDEF